MSGKSAAALGLAVACGAPASALGDAAGAAAGAPSGSAAASGPRVHAMIVARGAELLGVRGVTARATTLRVRGRRCAVAAGTPLAVLAAARRAGGPPFSVRDYGSCSRRARDSSSLFVTAVGGDRNRGQDGWVYKIGRRVGSTGAADPAGAFGDGRRLRSGERVLWFWCRHGRRGCQRTLEVRLTRGNAAPGAAVAATVRGYDDRGRGVPVRGALVVAGPVRARTDARGRARLQAPRRAGRHRVRALAAGMVKSFPATLAVRR